MCEKHPEAQGTVCGEFVCGFCYIDELVTRKVRHPKPYEYVQKADAHGVLHWVAVDIAN